MNIESKFDDDIYSLDEFVSRQIKALTIQLREAEIMLEQERKKNLRLMEQIKNGNQRRN